MKIAYILPISGSLTGKSNGIKMQAVTWKSDLEKKGHSVELINPWENYDWKIFDIIHFFSFGHFMTYARGLKELGANVVISPIVDSEKSDFSYKIASFCAIKPLRMQSVNSVLRESNSYMKSFFTRSDYESSKLKAVGIDANKIIKVPLSVKNEFLNIEKSNVQKEDFCLHISSYTQGRKNVFRLMQAAAKYKFNLVIAGNKGSSKDFKPFEDFAKQHSNITLKGFLSIDEMKDLYSRAKVFALPSIFEGVGLVALEAALYECDIVITNLGGPKEYYADYAQLVNPYSIDDIGNAVLKAMHNTSQPMLREHILKNYNADTCIDMLIDGYKKTINS